MRWLLFLSRLAFFCNVFLLFAVSLQLFYWLRNEDAQSTVIILGFIMAGFINPVVNLCYLFLFVANKNKLQVVPQWLIVSNIIFLFLQIIYLFYRNGR